MKLVEAVVRPHKLQDVKSALADIGVLGMTVTDVRGCGRQKGHVERYRGSEYTVDLLSKVKIEVVVKESQLDEVVETIATAARAHRRNRRRQDFRAPGRCRDSRPHRRPRRRRTLINFGF